MPPPSFISGGRWFVCLRNQRHQESICGILFLSTNIVYSQNFFLLYFGSVADHFIIYFGKSALPVCQFTWWTMGPIKVICPVFPPGACDNSNPSEVCSLQRLNESEGKRRPACLAQANVTDLRWTGLWQAKFRVGRYMQGPSAPALTQGFLLCVFTLLEQECMV